jgi:putative ABC transport system permease protein
VLGRPQAAVNQVDGEYFRTFEQRLISGRFFDATDLEPERRTIVVNQSLAEMVFGAQNPLGRRVRFFVRGGQGIDPPPPQPWWEIVGVVSNLAANGTGGNAIYRPLPSGNPAPWVSAATQGPSQPVHLILRTRPGGSGEASAHLRAITANLDPALRVDHLRTMEEIYREQMVGNILGGSALVVIMLGLLGLSIAGVYTLMAFTVTQRRREIGIRAALGAQPARLVGGIFRTVLVPIGWGAAVGASVAILLEYYQSAIILALMEGHVVTWVLPATEAFIVLVAFLAILGPARQAIRIDPLEALRDG